MPLWSAGSLVSQHQVRSILRLVSLPVRVGVNSTQIDYIIISYQSPLIINPRACASRGIVVGLSFCHSVCHHCLYARFLANDKC